MTEDPERLEADDNSDDRRKRKALSPSSQIGRLAQTGNTPEQRRVAARDDGDDSERWATPVEEDHPVERRRKD